MAISLYKHLETMLTVHDDFISRAWLFGFALFWPKCLILFCGACFLIFWTIKDWYGNTNRVLMLKVLEALEQTKVQ